MFLRKEILKFISLAVVLVLAVALLSLHILDNPEKPLSGLAWISQFKGSSDVEKLSNKYGFRDNVKSFISALKDAGAIVTISSTYRPPERAYLMYYAWQISINEMDPRKVPSNSHVPVEWWHGNTEASVKAAREMVKEYQIVHEPELQSNHTRGLAIDMNISWKNNLEVVDGMGNSQHILSSFDGSNPEAITQLIRTGSSYSIMHNQTDPVHWSIDGR